MPPRENVSTSARDQKCATKRTHAKFVSAVNFSSRTFHQSLASIFLNDWRIFSLQTKISTARDDVVHQSSKMGGPQQLHHFDVRITRWAPVTGDAAGAMCAPLVPSIVGRCMFTKGQEGLNSYPTWVACPPHTRDVLLGTITGLHAVGGHRDRRDGVRRHEDRREPRRVPLRHDRRISQRRNVA